MPDDLGTLLRERSEQVHVPPSNLEEVLRGGRMRRRVHTTVSGIGIIALLAILLLALGALSGREQRGSLPTVDQPPVPVDHRLLTIPAPEGAPPLEEDEAAVADAKAVTFAFHALVLNLDSYDLDYKNIERIDNGWRVLFDDGLSIEDLREFVMRRRGFVEELKGYLVDERAKLERLAGELAQAQVAQDASEINRLQDRVRETRRSLEGLQDELINTQAELVARKDELSELMAHGEPAPITLDVRLVEGKLTVDTFTGSLSPGEAAKIQEYSERVRDVDVHGVDFYNVTLTSDPGVDLPFEAYGFWTGPIPSTYQEECVLELRSSAGEILWRQPDVHDVYDKAPPNEDRRDDWVRGSDMEGIGVSLDDAEPFFVCAPRR